MRRFFSQLNPTVRGFLLIAAVALVIVVLSLDSTLAALYALVSIAFFLAVAFFVFLLWRERRGDIGRWSERPRFVFYGAALLAVADLALYFWRGASGPDALAFFLVLGVCVYAMVRVWRDQHRHTY
ncbi:MAG: hypothetical protein HY511_06560 [Actinobacteria bacterium]|nr:hypothetical protein [Actinomycetota bacterium]